LQSAFQQAGVAPGLAHAIEWGMVRDEIFAILCDYQNDASCDVGVENIYHALADLDGASDDTVDGEAISSLVVPFFGDSKDYAFQNAGRHVAWKVSGDTTRLLYYSDAGGSSVYEAEENGDTGELSVRLVGIWPYEGGAYGMRAEFSGNRSTHEFVLRIAKTDPTKPDSLFVSFRGAGTSRGEGNHFLFLSESINATDGDTQNGYHCVSATTGTDVDGNSTVEPHADCGGPGGANAAAIDSLVPLTRADIPSAVFESTF